MKKNIEKKLKPNTDIKPYLSLAQDVQHKVKDVVLKIAAIKIGYMEGFKNAQDCLHNEMNIPLEFSTDKFVAELDKITDLEMRLIAIASSGLSESNKEKLTEICVENHYLNQDNKKPSKNIVYQLLKEETEKVYKELGELPSRDINEVRKPKSSK